jgi:hypothetical protein
MHGRVDGYPTSDDVRRVSDLFRELERRMPGDRIALGEVAEATADRAFGLMLLVFALPNAIPHGIPGLSTLFGLPLLIVAAQLVLGSRRPWLPGWLAARTVPGAALRRIMRSSLPWVVRIERVLRPRWPWLTQTMGERLAGGVCLLLAGILALPIPFANAPMALAICIIALGLLARDGVVVMVGYTVAVVGTAAVSAGLIALADTALKLFQ